MLLATIDLAKCGTIHSYLNNTAEVLAFHRMKHLQNVWEFDYNRMC